MPTALTAINTIFSVQRILCALSGQQTLRLLCRVLSCERRTAGLVGGVEVHQLRTNAVGVVHVELIFPVLADFGRGIVPAVEPLAGLENCL